MKLEEFYSDEFRQNIIAAAHADGSQAKNTFLEYVFKIIEEQGYPPFQIAEYKETIRKGGSHAVDGWVCDDEGRLFLLYADFRNSDKLERLTEGDLTEDFAKIERFFLSSRKKDFVDLSEPAHPVYPLVRFIFEKHAEIRAVSFIVVSDAKRSDRVKTLPDSKVEGFKIMREVWDVERLWQIETEGDEREPIVIDFTETDKRGIPCLAVPSADSELQSYLIVFSGTLLANLYERYGERLLEQNVRTFLQFKGRVNKGIRETIIKKPRMFFAYNNGICATAEGVEVSADKMRLLKATNLQIVNGGQTTASIFTTNRKDKASISNIFVPAKLTVVEPERVGEIIPNISRFANTQNKVSDADFSSNSPFQVRVKEISEKLWAPSPNGGMMMTHWFYERSRAQYANATSKMTPTERRRFEQQNPKAQRFDKTELAKAVLAFDGKPYFVCLGAQKAFAKFAFDIGEQWRKNENVFNDLWFKEAVAKLIAFRSLDKAMKSDSWFMEYGSLKAQIIAYTLAACTSAIAVQGKALNFEEGIWQKQSVPEKLLAGFVKIAKKIAKIVVRQISGENLNISERMKKEKFWNDVRAEIVPSDLDIDQFLEASAAHELKVQTSIEDFMEKSGAEARRYVYEKGADYWCQLREWDNEKHALAASERKALEKACEIPRLNPSNKQSKSLKDSEARAIEEGFYVV